MGSLCDTSAWRGGAVRIWYVCWIAQQIGKRENTSIPLTFPGAPAKYVAEKIYADAHRCCRELPPILPLASGPSTGPRFLDIHMVFRRWQCNLDPIRPNHERAHHRGAQPELVLASRERHAQSRLRGDRKPGLTDEQVVQVTPEAASLGDQTRR